jgi:hypothetical protein
MMNRNHTKPIPKAAKTVKKKNSQKQHQRVTSAQAAEHEVLKRARSLAKRELQQTRRSERNLKAQAINSQQCHGIVDNSIQRPGQPGNHDNQTDNNIVVSMTDTMGYSHNYYPAHSKEVRRSARVNLSSQNTIKGSQWKAKSATAWRRGDTTSNPTSRKKRPIPQGLKQGMNELYGDTPTPQARHAPAGLQRTKSCAQKRAPASARAGPEHDSAMQCMAVICNDNAIVNTLKTTGKSTRIANTDHTTQLALATCNEVTNIIINTSSEEQIKTQYRQAVTAFSRAQGIKYKTKYTGKHNAIHRESASETGHIDRQNSTIPSNNTNNNKKER